MVRPRPPSVKVNSRQCEQFFIRPPQSELFRTPQGTFVIFHLTTLSGNSKSVPFLILTRPRQKSHHLPTVHWKLEILNLNFIFEEKGCFVCNAPPLCNSPLGILATHLILSLLSNVLDSSLNFEGLSVVHLTLNICVYFLSPLSLNYTKELVDSILEIDLPLTSPSLLAQVGTTLGFLLEFD